MWWWWWGSGEQPESLPASAERPTANLTTVKISRACYVLGSNLILKYNHRFHCEPCILHRGVWGGWQIFFEDFQGTDKPLFWDFEAAYKPFFKSFWGDWQTCFEAFEATYRNFLRILRRHTSLYWEFWVDWQTFLRILMGLLNLFWGFCGALQTILRILRRLTNHFLTILKGLTNLFWGARQPAAPPAVAGLGWGLGVQGRDPQSDPDPGQPGAGGSAQPSPI